MTDLTFGWDLEGIRGGLESWDFMGHATLAQHYSEDYVSLSISCISYSKNIQSTNSVFLEIHPATTSS